MRLCRGTLLRALAAVPLLPPLRTNAEVPTVTGKAFIDVTIGQQEPRRITLGMFGDAAPASVKLFSGLCDGSLADFPGLSYRASTVSRVEKDKILVFGRLSGGAAQGVDRTIDATGYVRSTLVDRASSYANKDENALSHDLSLIHI